MKNYFAGIKFTQELFLAVSIIILATLPASLALNPQWFSEASYMWLYAITHAALFFVMLIRPLADVFRGVNWLRPLVILRKGVGVFSAAIVVSFILAKIITDGSLYFADIATADYWSLDRLALFAHLADISAILLLITSNNLSKRLLGKSWKRIQRLSYVYFYASSIYVIFMLDEITPIFYVAIVTLFTALAWMRNQGYILKTSNLRTA